MSTTDQQLVLAELSWPEVAAIRDEVEVVLQPVGSTEQHGPNIALCMDIAAAFEFCRRASERLYPRVLVAPPVPWGVSFHHMNFPGTITLSPATFAQVLTEVVGSLHQHGFERYLIINGHGGNVAAMNSAIVRIREEINPLFIGAANYFSFGETPITDHAGDSETSVAMELIPDMVKTEALAPGEITDLSRGFNTTLQRYSVGVPYRFDEYTRNGALGDATQATRDRGREMVEDALDNFVVFIDELVANSPGD